MCAFNEKNTLALPGHYETSLDSTAEAGGWWCLPWVTSQLGDSGISSRRTEESSGNTQQNPASTRHDTA